MHHKLLLGSTALVGASLLLANTAAAQEFEVSLSGFTEFGVTAATEETFIPGEDNRGYDFFMDTEIIVRADGSHNGINYGSKVELEVYSIGTQGNSSTNADEGGLYFSGGFGRIELGRDDGAEDVMFVGAEDAQAGTGGLDGDTRNLGTINLFNTGDAAKVSYFTPRIAGFQLGASYTPDTGDNATSCTDASCSGRDDNPADFEQSIGAGINWVGAMGGLDLILSAVGHIADDETGDRDDVESYSVGGRLGIGGLQFGATWGQRLDFDETDFAMVGVKFGLGPANASLGYERDWVDDGDDRNIFIVSGDVGLLPGVVLKGDVSYNTDDPDDDGDDTIAGVLTVQLNY